MTTLEDYVGKIKTGQDLIDEGVIPKTSAVHLALITEKRLEAIREGILSQINDEMLGSWIPGAKLNYHGKITDPSEVYENIKVGLPVVGVGEYDHMNIDGMKGVVKTINRNQIGIEFDKKLPLSGEGKKGHNLKGAIESEMGWWVESAYLNIPRGKAIKGAQLLEGVVADPKLGHKARFKGGYQGDHILFPETEIFQITKYDEESNFLSFKTKNEYDGDNEFGVELNKVADILEVSSLGQIEPKNKEEEVRKQTYLDFFPKTKLDEKTAESILIGLVMGKNPIYEGPFGCGKSQVSEDTVEIAEQQKAIFKVDGCKVQCNPYSLMDSEEISDQRLREIVKKFQKKVKPCAECMIKYDKGNKTQDFRKTGIFIRPKPFDIDVIVAKYSHEGGNGIEHTEGTVGLDRMNIAGYKIPKLDGSTTKGMESDSDPEGFHPGIGLRTNNGIFWMEEMDKLLPQTLDGVLELANSKRIKPDQLRFLYPANSYILGTCNDSTKLSLAINDRFLIININYPQDVDTSNEITQSTYHGDFAEAKDIDIGDTHKEKGNGLRKIPMPNVVERAVDALYIKFRKEYKEEGMNMILGSNRSKFDALDASRVIWTLDKMFYDDTPEIVDPSYAEKGMEYAIFSRLQGTNGSVTKAKDKISSWIKDNFQEVLTQEEDTWWCRVYQNMGISSTQIPEIEANFTGEVAKYQKDSRTSLKTFEKIKYARENPTDINAQRARIKNPFMDYLFNHQPHFSDVNETQLIGMVDYLANSRKEHIKRQNQDED
jgi:MoxR-like ATPase